MPRPSRLLPSLALLLLAACAPAMGEEASESAGPPPALTFQFVPETATPTPTPTPSPTRPPTPAPTPTPSPTPPPTPERTPTPARVSVPAQGAAFVIGDGVALRSKPSTQEGEIVGRLSNLQEIRVLRSVKGERWIVGDQDWPMAYQPWTDTWFEVEGGYVYSAYVFIPKAGESSPFIRTADRWIDVDIKTQTLRAMVGDQPVFFAAVTTGKNNYETPPGRYTVGNWRVANETMTSGQAAINDPAESYNVKNVLYTQYFNTLGDALHLNYWQPESVFGSVRTSHGCVGLHIHDAQWLWLFTQGGVRLEIH